MTTSAAEFRMRLVEILNILEAAGREMNNLQPLGYSIDSRTLRSGELFFAIRGENNDGHRFVGDALEKGALAAVVAGDFESSSATRCPEVKLIRVGDTLTSLQSLAAAVVRSWKGRLVAVTGSSGKTTTKDLTAAALSGSGPVIKSTGNLNNQYGLPLSVLRMESDGARAEEFKFAVFEMGMNHAGEIALLTRIAPPDIGVVTNVGAAHLEFFKSVDEIAAAKAEMVLGIRPGGTAVLNADDERVSRMRLLRQDITIYTFGFEQPADVTAREIESTGLSGTSFILVTRQGKIKVTLPLFGRHNLSNALAAAAIADMCEVPLDSIGSALETASSARMRGELLRLAGGITVIDDSYNSNPRALREMVTSLASVAGGRRIVAAGEMLELGESSADLHREAGRFIAGQKIDLLVGVRGMAREIVAGAVAADLAGDKALFCDTPEEAGELLAVECRQGDVVLVKGSRGVRMEKAVEVLKRRLGIDQVQQKVT